MLTFTVPETLRIGVIALHSAAATELNFHQQVTDS